jgi:uncharacterized protein (TIGR02646 family)
MRAVTKRRLGPPELLRYRKTNVHNLIWEALPGEEKRLVPEALLEDQGHLCCYCMKRIRDDAMKVEHYRAQSKYPDAALEWDNLLATCLGEGGPQHQQTCDTKKGNADLTLDPRVSHVARNLRYLIDGSIRSTDTAESRDLEEHLNLNFEGLKRQRTQAYDALLAMLQKRLGHKRSWTKAKLESELARIRSARPFEQFLGAYEYWLAKWIRARDR